MSILIGCSPSSGSSLLRRILNRHSKVFCGSETSLLAKAALYTDWQKHRKKLIANSIWGLPNAGWHKFIGIELTEEYGYTKVDFKRLMEQEHSSFQNFISAFYQPILKKYSKQIWAEKTPSNAFTLHLFLDAFPEGKAIHIVRHPLDAIASLTNRGMSAYNAVAVYLLNTAKALELINDPRVITLKYEDLVMRPQRTLEELCKFLEITYEEKMLLPPGKEGGVESMKGWNYKETETVQQGSMGRFQKLQQAKQDELLSRVLMTKTSLPLQHRSIAAIAKQLDYDLPLHSIEVNMKEILKRDKARDLRSRLFSKTYFNKANYPISFE